MTPDWFFPHLRRLSRRHLSPGGRLLAGAAAMSAVLGLDPFDTQLDALFTVAAGLAVVGLLVGLLFRRRLSGGWTVPPRAVCGATVRAVVRVRNADRRAAYELDASLDRIPLGLSAWAASRIDRLEPGASGELQLRLHTGRRGAYTLGPPYVGTLYPFGILRWGCRLGEPRRLLVTPRILLIRSLRLHPGLRYQPGGVPLASRTGESLEFIGAREYRRGDSLRRIHWKLWARRGVPVVREYSQEYFTRVGVILDTFLARNSPDQFEAAAVVAASVADYLARHDAIVDFFAAGDQVLFLSAGRHLGPLTSILDALACVEPAREPAYAVLETRIGGLLPQLSALLVITFDLSPRREAFLERLRGAGVPIRVLVVGPGRGTDPDIAWIDPSQLEARLEDL